MNSSSSLTPLKTKRLVLRPLLTSDSEAIAALRLDDNVNKYLGRPKTTDITQAAAFIEKINNSVAEGSSYYWAITLPGDGKLTGAICLWNIDRNLLSVEIGFEMLPAFQGTGLMTEALSAVIEYIFTTSGLKLIMAYTDPANERSVRLLEKSGFKETMHPKKKKD